MKKVKVKSEYDKDLLDQKGLKKGSEGMKAD
jgi:hypothetical protein